MFKEIFDLKRYQLEQILDAVMCPVNRHGVRKKKSVDDWGLYKLGPMILLDHYIENGGAEAFAKRRAEFIKRVEVPDEVELEYYI